MGQHEQASKTRFAVLRENKKAKELVAYEDGIEDLDDEGLPSIGKISYKSLPVDIPSNFLAPLPDPDIIKVKKIDFKASVLPEYKNCYAVILDNVLNEEECQQLIHMAESSAGGHCREESAPDDGWRPAMVSAGANYEFLDLEYRNSDRIIWDNKVLMERLWTRILQGKGMKEYFSVLDGKEYKDVIGWREEKRGDRYVISEQGLNERMRFLKYGEGQYFRPHCDGMYETPHGEERSYYTMHLYLNDSAQVLGGNTDGESFKANPLHGGATTFHDTSYQRRLDADPKIGRVLIFQQRMLLHSGDEVVKGVKYTMRSDLMYCLDMKDPVYSDGTEYGNYISFG